jgi:ankyrin repeat protein
MVGATPLWLAARLTEPNVMRLLVKYGADPLFVHHADYVTLSEASGYEHHNDTTTALMAATGMGGRVTPWVQQPGRTAREALTLEAVKLAVELGVDVNAADTDGRTALDAAKALKYDAVVKFLVENGALPGTVKKRQTASADKD